MPSDRTDAERLVKLGSSIREASVMMLVDQAAARVALAAEMGRVPLRWIVSEAIAAELEVDRELHGVPIERGETRWDLELICAAAAG